MRALRMGGVALAAGMTLAFTLGLGVAPSRMPATQLPSPVATACVAPARLMARLELLFGTTKADGTLVAETDWLAFLDREVTPRFPDGLTVLTGVGQWRNAKGQIGRETSRVLLIWYAPGPQSETNISAIRDTYRQRFAQESVMRVDSAGCVEF